MNRRDLLRMALAAGGAVAFAPSPSLALRLAQLLNGTRYSDLPPKTIEHAKILIASTQDASRKF